MPGSNCSIISGTVADAIKLMNVCQGLMLVVVNVCQGGYCQKVVTDVVSGRR